MASGGFVPPNRDFLGKPAPPGYIPGIGRGATGFTTRGDLGSIATTRLAEEETDETGASNRTQDQDDFGLFAGSAQLDAEDLEADDIYAQVELKMQQKRAKQREMREREEEERARRMRPTIQQQFADVKRHLAEISPEEWASLPEAVDLRSKHQRQVMSRLGDRFTPLPDSVIRSVASVNEYDKQVNDTMASGMATPMTDFKQIGTARNAVLTSKLDQQAVSGTSTSIDPKGYLTDLASVVVKSENEVSDLKKARQLLQSVTTTNPTHAPGWIALARLEETAGQMVQAREIILQACETCPKSEDVWLEAVRLLGHKNQDEAASLLASAVSYLPESVKIWLKAASLEQDPVARKRVLRRALENVPQSERLWMAAIDMETSQLDARLMLQRAVECVPLSIPLWLALARVSPYEQAKSVLNRARQSLPTSHEIWLAAAQLEEKQPGHEQQVERIVQRAMQMLSQRGAALDRERWLNEAEQCEEKQAPLTCQAIVRACIGIGVDEQDRKHVWLQDAEQAIERKRFTTARAIFAQLLLVFPHKKGVWRRAADFERTYFGEAEASQILSKAVAACPQAEVLWLMYAKSLWQSNHVAGARAALQQAFQVHPESESIWLAAVKLEASNGEIQRARQLLTRAREKVPTERVFMKSAVLERQCGEKQAAMTLCRSGWQKFPKASKLYLIAAQLARDQDQIQEARQIYALGCEQCPDCIALWIEAAHLDQSQNILIRARAILEKARLIHPQNERIWLASVRTESTSQHVHMAQNLLVKALAACPQSGLLWAEAIAMEPRVTRRSKTVDALRQCTDKNVWVLIAVARYFWSEHRLDKAKTYLERACQLDPDCGDTWAYLYRLQMEQEMAVDDLVEQCTRADPKHGLLWPTIRKRPELVDSPMNEILRRVAQVIEVVYP